MLAAIGARVIDRELPIGMADDAFAADGTLLDEDISLDPGRHPRRAPRRDPPACVSLKGQSPPNSTAPPGSAGRGRCFVSEVWNLKGQSL